MWRLLRPDATAVLNDEMVKKTLARYFAVTQDEKAAKFIIAKKVPADFSESDSLEELWQKHMRLTREFYKIEAEIDAKTRNILS